MLWLVVVGGLFITGPCDVAWVSLVASILR